MITPAVMKSLVLSMNAPDNHVVRMRYRDKDGVVTERVVSPIRFIGRTAMMALCLSREEPRRFELDQCSQIELMDASDVLMPVELRIINDGCDQSGAKPGVGDNSQANSKGSAGSGSRDSKGGQHRAPVFP